MIDTSVVATHQRNMNRGDDEVSIGDEQDGHIVQNASLGSVEGEDDDNELDEDNLTHSGSNY